MDMNKIYLDSRGSQAVSGIFRPLNYFNLEIFRALKASNLAMGSTSKKPSHLYKDNSEKYKEKSWLTTFQYLDLALFSLSYI